ncbi:NAD-dependent epimerase/dehydratase family protein [Streptomyces sp. PmtG]
MWTAPGSVADAAAAHGVRRLVYLSSTSVYGLPDVVPTPESHPVAPEDTYGRAKVDAESACSKAASDELSVTVLRPKTFIGPGRLGLFSLLFEWAAAGRNFPVLGSGDVIAQLCSTEDVAAAVELVLAAPQGEANDVYNIASVEFGSLRDDFQAVLDAAGHGKRVISIPMGPAVPVLQALARMRLSPVYRRLVHKLRSDSYVSIDKARAELGFEPRQSSEEAILSAFTWWLERQGDEELHTPGNASNNRWRQGALGLARVLF